MCGICGYIDFSSKSGLEVLDEMTTTLRHRGPDDKGLEVFSSDIATVGLGHSRLSIIDLSSAGHQPMIYRELSIVFNGEIYNFKEIRKELDNLGHVFISDSDTEVVLHAFYEWGTICVSKFIGMFVIVILNKKTLELTIIRDRAGIKPLFYYWQDGLFLFTSELKAFHKHPNFNKELNFNAIRQYMDFGYVPSPHCIFKNCYKLDPGHILTFSLVKREYDITKYWDIKDYYCMKDLNISYEEAKQEVEKLLQSAFEYRMVSDVPVGVFLSGGYDSTAVVALLQRNATDKLKTFTIGFEQGNNEAPFASDIARFFGTDHTEYYCKTSEAQAIIPDLPYYYDEPFSDSSVIPTTLVSKLARKRVTVALSADAGDEIFAGYANYKTFLNNLQTIDRIPGFLRKTFGKLAEGSTNFLPDNSISHKISVLSHVLTTDEKKIPQTLLRSYLTLNKSSINKLFSYDTTYQETVFDGDFSKFKDNLSIALATDYIMYLQNDILAKVDRATMSVSLEGREPLLDHRVIEFVAQLPSKFKYGQTQKMILKDIVHQYIPKHKMDRPKTGFSPPVFSWLRGDLSYLIEDNLNSTIVSNIGLFNPAYVQKLKRDFMDEKLYDQTIIWKLLQFQMWYKTWMR
jgi:asparagine synthase (glutamine-hydrolysing)